MRICGSWLLLIVPAVVVALPADAPALVPQEVLVVTNANAKGSVALGKYYCAIRNILQERMIVLRCTAGPEISREEYDEQIRDPIREYLARHDPKGKIKCLALIWGVPVRVEGPELTPEQSRLVKAYKTMSMRLHARLGVNRKLLGKVGVGFPQPRTDGLVPLGHLFERGTIATPKKLAKPANLKRALAGEMKRKAKAMTKLADRRKRHIALRQLAALELACHGLRRLPGKLPAEKVPGVPAAAAIRKQISSAEAELAKLKAGKETPQAARRTVELVRKLRGAAGAHSYCRRRIKAIDTAEDDAAVDSELPLLWEKNPPLRRWRPNPMCWRMAAQKTRPANMPDRIIMAARIDGPKPRDALRIIKDSVAAEKTALAGKFYIDAGGKYPVYDKNLKVLATMVKKATKIPVILDTDKRLFRPGTCPDAALYVGWYSVRKYVPAFTWVRGSVGWHVASLEAVHLRAPASEEWCVKMIQNGVAATLGAVNEPFLHAFPLPQDFFALLLTGKFTVAECYWRTVPTLSWRMTLIADPLYNPFRLKPQLSTYDLPPELGGRSPLPAFKAPTTLPAPGGDPDD